MLRAHSDLGDGPTGIAVGGEHSVGRVGVGHVGHVDGQRGCAGLAIDSLHPREAVDEVTFGETIAIVEEIVRGVLHVSGRTVRSPGTKWQSRYACAEGGAVASVIKSEAAREEQGAPGAKARDDFGRLFGMTEVTP